MLAGQAYVSRQIAGAFAAGGGSEGGRAAAAQITPREKQVLSLVARGYGTPTSPACSTSASSPCAPTASA